MDATATMKTPHIILAALGFLAAACLLTDIPFRIRGPILVAAPFVLGTLWMGYSKRGILFTVALAASFVTVGMVLPPPWPAKLEMLETIRIVRNAFFVAIGVSLALIYAGRLVRIWVDRKRRTRNQNRMNRKISFLVIMALLFSTCSQHIPLR